MQERVSLAPYTLYKIGGPARYFQEARRKEDLISALAFAQAQNMPFLVLGAGSNMLISDHGFPGVVIRMAGGEIRVEGERIRADAGVMMARAVLVSADAGLTGFEWGIGVPGTIGGSIRGNAGCFGGEIKDIVESVDLFDTKKMTNYKLQTTDCAFAYRDSFFKRHPEWIILSAMLRLKRGDVAFIKKRIAQIIHERTLKQDIGAKSCGCIFKNPSWPAPSGAREKFFAQFPECTPYAQAKNIPASFLLDCAGMKNSSLGGARISAKHANYFINEGNATAEDVRALIARAKEAVMAAYGIKLKEEIQYVGFEP